MNARDALTEYAASTRTVTADGLAPYIDRVVKEARGAAFAEAADALRERAGELSELAEEKMSRSLEERAQEWREAAEKVARLAP